MKRFYTEQLTFKRGLLVTLFALLISIVAPAPVFSEEVAVGLSPWSIDFESGLTIGRFEVPPGSGADLVATILSIRGGGSVDLRIPINTLWSYGTQVGIYSMQLGDAPFVDLPVGAFVQMGSSSFFVRLRSNYILSTTFTGGPLVGAQVTMGPVAFSWDYVFAPIRYSRFGLSLFFPDVWTFSPPGSKAVP